MVGKRIFICTTCKFNKNQDLVPSNFTFDTMSDFEFHFYSLPDLHSNKKLPEDALQIKESKVLKTTIEVDHNEEVSKSVSTEKSSNTNNGSTPMMTPKRKGKKKAKEIVDQLLNETDDSEKENDVNNDSDGDHSLVMDMSPTTSTEGMELSEEETESTLVTITKYLVTITTVKKTIPMVELTHKKPLSSNFKIIFWYLKDCYWSSKYFEGLLQKSVATKQYYLNLKNESIKMLGNDYTVLRTMISNVVNLVNKKKLLEEKAKKSGKPEFNNALLNRRFDGVIDILPRLVDDESLPLLVEQIDEIRNKVKNQMIKKRVERAESFNPEESIKTLLMNELKSLALKHKSNDKYATIMGQFIACFDVHMYLRMKFPGHGDKLDLIPGTDPELLATTGNSNTNASTGNSNISELVTMIKELKASIGLRNNNQTNNGHSSNSHRSFDSFDNQRSNQNSNDHRGRGKLDEIFNDIFNRFSQFRTWIETRSRTRTRNSTSTTIPSLLNSKERNILIKGRLTETIKLFPFLNKHCTRLIRVPMNKINDFIHDITDYELLVNKKSEPMVHNLTDISFNETQLLLLCFGKSFIRTPNELSSEEINHTFDETIYRTMRKYTTDGENNKSFLPFLNKKIDINWESIDTSDPNIIKIGRIMNKDKMDKMIKENHHEMKNNLTQNEERAMKDIKKLINNHDLLLIEADKNMGLCIIKRNEYEKRIMNEITILGDSFEVKPANEKEMKEIIEASIKLKDKLNKQIRDTIIINVDDKDEKKKVKSQITKYLNTQLSTELPTIKGMPKLHKAGERMRIILPFNDNIFTSIHGIIATILQPLALRLDSSLISSLELMNELENKELDSNDWIITADLDSMYNRINIELAAKLIIDYMEIFGAEYINFGDKSKMANRNIWTFIIAKAFEMCYFKFKDKIIKQANGVAMGSPAGPIIAIIYINRIIAENIDKFSDIKIIKLYIDDGFLIINGSVPKDDIHNMLDDLIKYKNSPLEWDRKSITINRIKELETNSVTFLDTNIKSESLNEMKSKLIFSVYCKPMGTYQYVHKRSAHQQSVKKAVAYGEAIRRVRLCTKEYDYEATLNDLREKLMRRGYSLDEINRQIDRVPFSKRHELINKPITKFKNMRDKNVNKNPLKNPIERIESNLVPIIIRYDPNNIKGLQTMKRKIEQEVNEEIFIDTKLESVRMILSLKRNKTLINELSKPPRKKQKTENERPRLTDPNLD